jgi:D-alanyl-D-alanine carboxypeptidase
METCAIGISVIAVAVLLIIRLRSWFDSGRAAQRLSRRFGVHYRTHNECRLQASSSSSSSSSVMIGDKVSLSDIAAHALDKAKIARTEQQANKIVDKMMAKYRIPASAIRIMQTPCGDHDASPAEYRQILLLLKGTAELGKKTPITSDMHWAIGSVTKSMTSYLVMLLCRRKQMSLEDTLEQYFPEFTNASKITVLQMLNMTSGLADYETSDKFDEIFNADPLVHWNTRDLVRWAQQQPPTFRPPASSWKYCNTGYVLLGLVCSKILNLRLEDAFQRYLFEPLGMQETTLRTSDNPLLPIPHPHGYGNHRGTLEDCTDWNPGWAYAAGAVQSTLHDMHKWACNIGSGGCRVGIADDELQDIYSNNASATADPARFDKKSFYYSQGVIMDNNWVWHNGSIPCGEALVAYHRVLGMSIVIFVNQNTLPEFKLADSTVTLLFRELVKIYAPEFPAHVNY